jgi:SET domain-containing protein 6
MRWSVCPAELWGEAPQDMLTQNDYYFHCAEPLLLRHLVLHNSIPSSKPSLQGFYRAYSLVSSRAFLVDAYHGLSMVPVADAFVHLKFWPCPSHGRLNSFNHEQDNHVHLQVRDSSLL